MNYTKVDSIISNIYETGDMRSAYLNHVLKKHNLQKLHEYQILHVYGIIDALKTNNVVLDGSNTGTGKTYTTACVCKELGLNPIIICPKSIINIWHNVLDYFGVKPIAIVNYDMIKNGNMYGPDGKIIPAPFIKVVRTEKTTKFIWDIKDPRKTIIIFDEAHKCKNKNTLQSELMLSTKLIGESGRKPKKGPQPKQFDKPNILLISATISDTIESFMLFGYMLGFYSGIPQGRNWIRSVMTEDLNRLTNTKISTLSQYIYPSKGSRMSIDDIGDKFPKNLIIPECYTVDAKSLREINEYWAGLKLTHAGADGGELTIGIKQSQFIEAYKVPIIIDNVEKYLDNGKSIAIFVRFSDTFNGIKEELDGLGISYAEVRGEQDIDSRSMEINKFQTNMVRVIICMIQTGGQSISLHDVNGTNPRVSLISPGFSSIELIQTLGRVYRMGTITPVIQLILFCADTYEQTICKRIKEKISFINYLSDEDLVSFDGF